jgi:hypothetical protein
VKLKRNINCRRIYISVVYDIVERKGRRSRKQKDTNRAPFYTLLYRLTRAPADRIEQGSGEIGTAPRPARAR